MTALTNHVRTVYLHPHPNHQHQGEHKWILLSC